MKLKVSQREVTKIEVKIDKNLKYKDNRKKIYEISSSF